MGAFEDQPVVGLFGVCGSTTFRQDYLIPELKRQNIDFYNPQVAEGTWEPWMAEEEADHLVHDMVQTWPMTGETYAGGTGAEEGFSIASSIRSDSPYPKFVIPMIEMKLAPELVERNPEAAAESMRARKLAAAHLARTASPNVYVVDSMEEMLETAVIAYGAARSLAELVRSKNPAYRRFVQGREQAEAFARAMESGQLGAPATTIAMRAQHRR